MVLAPLTCWGLVTRTDRQLSELACAALRGEAPVWPFGRAASEAKAFTDYCGYHGVGPLVLRAMRDKSAWTTWHGAVREQLQREYRGLTALELARHSELQSVLAKLAAAGIESILLKGTALAYGLYAEPVLRTRTDTDLLIDAANKTKAFALLRELGYRTPNAIKGEYVSSQQTFLKQQQGVTHAIDLHWRISNAQVFARQFPFAELWSNAEPVSALGASAFRLSAPYALLHACLHRAVHIQRGEGDRLQWYYDMHLLVDRLDEHGWSQTMALAGAKGLRRICADALSACRQRLASAIPEPVMTTLANPEASAELSSALLDGRRLKTEWVNYRALPGWRARARLLREQLLPDVNYMRRRYGVTGGLALTRAYLARLLRGPLKLFETSRRRATELERTR